ncbi:hypothetical protein NYR77_09590 [Actinobacillus equuli subsp. haemolyticus]|uniref:tetratricopeptide repeat protein n=1 Tax=Actinobacillus equuli TaxID=718 RepID=UPI0024413FC1|nr:hypothetical protein [Actinobacillus equuli]WGE63019.1 hypothetical protein NYR75_09740 [Actinobacillus equuli subsp. haemolyticus]WGE67224.1 hypothetical protein NYR77_09590 [Actinobacillus equuli subsp. haemolyticus]
MVNNIQELFKNKDYLKIIQMLHKLELSKLDFETIRLLAISFFKTKKLNLCIQVCQFIENSNNDLDYFLCEILAECYWFKNDLELSQFYFEKALELNPKLIGAKYKNFILKYRLGKELNIFELREIEHIVKKRNKVELLKILNYIQLKEGINNTILTNLTYAIEKSENNSSTDYITLSELHKKIGNLTSSNRYKKYYFNNLFKFDFIDNNEKNLFITLSSNSGFILSKYPFRGDRLNIVDLSESYYMLSINNIAEKVIKLQKDKSYEKISIVGLSKGGTAAIMLINILQEYLPNITIKAVACSPQIELWPFNKNLTILSYRSLAEKLACNHILEKLFLKAQKSIRFKINNGNLLSIFYGDKFLMDVNEVEKISNTENVDIIKLNFSGHATGIPLTIPENKTKEELRGKYENLVVDNDSQELDGNIVDILDEIYAIYSNPQMRLYKFL